MDIYINGTKINFELEYLLKQYTMNGTGFYDQKQTTLDSRIKRKDTDITDYKKKLDDELAKLKETFYKMEKAQKDLQDNTKKLDSFNKQN